MVARSSHVGFVFQNHFVIEIELPLHDSGAMACGPAIEIGFIAGDNQRLRLDLGQRLGDKCPFSRQPVDLPETKPDHDHRRYKHKEGRQNPATFKQEEGEIVAHGLF